MKRTVNSFQEIDRLDVYYGHVPIADKVDSSRKKRVAQRPLK